MTIGLTALTLTNELRILDIAFKNEGEITQEKLKENKIDFREPTHSLKKGYLRIIEGKFPFCNYEITNDGRRYYALAESNLNQLREKI